MGYTVKNWEPIKQYFNQFINTRIGEIGGGLDTKQQKHG